MEARRWQSRRTPKVLDGSVGVGDGGAGMMAIGKVLQGA
jgi:hypothetical protein